MKATLGKEAIVITNEKANRWLKDKPMTLSEAAFIMLQCALELNSGTSAETVRANMNHNGKTYCVEVNIKVKEL